MSEVSCEYANNLLEQLEKAEARVRELEDLFQHTHGVHSSWVARGDAAEQELAAANALLRDAPYAPGARGQDWERRRDAHLAGQPAAPSRTEAEPVWDAVNKRWTKVLPRTEAEQAVLDAMAEVPENNVRVIVDGSINLRGLPKAFAAEMARRGLK